MHAGIGATGADELDRLAHHLLDRVAQLAHHRAHTIVLGEPVERRAVVRNGQPGSPQHRRSTIAAPTRVVVEPRRGRQHGIGNGHDLAHPAQVRRCDTGQQHTHDGTEQEEHGAAIDQLTNATSQ